MRLDPDPSGLGLEEEQSEFGLGLHGLEPDEIGSIRMLGSRNRVWDKLWVPGER